MTDYTTLRVTEEAKAAAEESKRSDETWNEFIQRCTDNPPRPKEFVDGDAIVSPEEIVKQFERAFPYDDVAERAAQKTADELEGRMR